MERAHGVDTILEIAPSLQYVDVKRQLRSRIRSVHGNFLPMGSGKWPVVPSDIFYLTSAG